MLKIALIGFLFAYICNALINFIHFLQICKGIRLLSKFIKVYNQHRNTKKQRKQLLRYFPVISKYIGPHSDRLYYSDDNFTICYRAVPMRDSLFSKRDIQIRKLIESFNPLCGLKALFMFPSQFLLWCGIRPKRVRETTVNIIGIIFEALVAKAVEAHYSEFEAFLKSIPDIIRDIWSSIP